MVTLTSTQQSPTSVTAIMIWVRTLIALGSLVAAIVGQQKYGPYTGPPVVPVILPGGFLADTEEVAAAKQYFLNALAKTAKEVKDQGHKNYYNTGTYQAASKPQQAAYQPSIPRYQPQPQGQLYTQYRPQPQSQQQRFTQPKAQYFTEPQAHRPAPVHEGEQYDDGYYRDDQYSGVYTTRRPDPMVTPVILDNGYIADTQEVNAAKAEHFAAVAKAQEAVARAAERAAKQQPALPASRPSGPSGYSSGLSRYQESAPAPPVQGDSTDYY